MRGWSGSGAAPEGVAGAADPAVELADGDVEPPDGVGEPGARGPLDGLRSSRRSQVLLCLRIVASAAMLGLLLSRIDLSVLNPVRQLSSWWWVITGVLATGGALVIATLRWQRVLQAMGLRSDLNPLLSHVLAGTFVSNFLPTTVGGDVLRVARLSADNGQREESFASVVLERLTGFVVLPCITLVALVANPALLHLGTASRLALSLSLGTLGVLVVILVAAGSQRLGRALGRHSRWLSFLRAVHLGLHRLRSHPAEAASVLAAALAYQLMIVLAAWLGGHALGLNMGWSAAMAFVPIMAIAQVLPVSVNGLGVREGALVLLLAPLGVAAGQAVALGLLLYGMNLVVSLFGAPAFAVGPRPLRAVV